MEKANAANLIRPITSVLVALALIAFQWILVPTLHPFMWLFLYPAVFFSSWIDGLRGAIISAVIATFSAFFLFMPETGIPDFTDYLALGIFIIMSLLFGFTNDYLMLSKRKHLKTESRLIESENKYRIIVDNLPKSMIFILDTKFRFVQSGGNQLGAMNISDEALSGKSVFEVFPSEVTMLLEPSYYQALEGRESTCETFFRSIFWSNNFVPIFDKNGKVENVLILSIDIDAQKKTETELRIAQKKLNLALENANIGVWEWNVKTNEMIWDSRMERIFNMEPGTFGNTYSSFENSINEEDLPHFRESITKTLKMDIPFETVFRSRTINGDSKYISTKALVNRYKSGKPVGLTGVCFDVTSMKKGTERALFKLNEELMRSNKDLQQFAYVASHDLQEPLRMVSSFTQMLEQRYKDKLDTDGREFIMYAVEGSKRMYFLLNGLLAYSRVQSRAKVPERIKMSEVLEKVLKNLSLKIEEKKALIIIKKMPVIFADENQMIQLFQNLIENGLKFSKGIPEITISTKMDSEFHVFSVRDEGIGIEPQYFEKIFKIFQRLSRDYEGTGIGLAICKRIVEGHGGSIKVESEYGKGCTFIIRIPRNKPSAIF
jgi:PAS domain S-box-containing protein